jgi:hypothetical protein
MDSLSKETSWTPEDRAHEIEGALDWMRNNGVSPDDGNALKTFNKAGSIQVSHCTPEERKKDAGVILAWMRNRKPKSLDPTQEFKEIHQLLPKKKG